MNRRLLGIYLNDHLAGATAGVELARRSRGSNQGNEYGEVLDRIAREIDEDRNTLKELMDRLEIKRDHQKVAFGWIAEKIGRLKPNGQLTGYSPLSRLIELEGLALGISGKLSLFEALMEVADGDTRLGRAELTQLSQRAERQRAEVWRLRQRAAREALA
jgi:hypothetical protein